MNQQGQINRFVSGTVIFLVGLVVIVALLPVMSALMPGLTDLFGGTVQVMLSSMILLIVAALLWNYLQDALPEEQMPGL